MNDDHGFDTPQVRDGAVQYVECPHCGAKPGETCRLTNSQTWTGRALRGFAHVGRRMEYHSWRDIFGPPTKSWEFSLRDPHQRTEVQTLPPCSLARPHCASCSQCECGALLADHAEVRRKLAKQEAAPSEPLCKHGVMPARQCSGYPHGEPKVSSADVDDLLG